MMGLPIRHCDFDSGLAASLRRARQLGVVPPREILVVNIARQAMGIYSRIQGISLPLPLGPDAFVLRQCLLCSTSKFGIGEQAGSNKTPRGLHRIARKIGGGWPVGTVFKSRQAIGYTWKGMPSATITTRILWLDGLEPGFNHGEGRDSFSRYIYIHGTGDERSVGRPASHGCVQLKACDLIPLYRQIPVETLVWISER